MFMAFTVATVWEKFPVERSTQLKSDTYIIVRGTPTAPLTAARKDVTLCTVTLFAVRREHCPTICMMTRKLRLCAIAQPVAGAVAGT